MKFSPYARYFLKTYLRITDASWCGLITTGLWEQEIKIYDFISKRIRPLTYLLDIMLEDAITIKDCFTEKEIHDFIECLPANYAQKFRLC